MTTPSFHLLNLIDLLPKLTGAQMKCLLVLFAIYFQSATEDTACLFPSVPGQQRRDTQPVGSFAVSQSDLARLTRLNRNTVRRVTQFLEAQGWIESTQFGNSKVYKLKLDSKLRELNRRDNAPSLDSLRAYATKCSSARLKSSIDRAGLPVSEIHKKLLSCGVYASVIAELLNTYPDEKLERHYRYYEYALAKGFARSPGWLVSSLRQDWPAPPGFEDPDPASKYKNSKYRAFYANFDDDE